MDVIYNLKEWLINFVSSNNHPSIVIFIIRIGLWLAVSKMALSLSWKYLGSFRSKFSQYLVFLLVTTQTYSMDLSNVLALDRVVVFLLFLIAILSILFFPKQIAFFITPLLKEQIIFIIVLYLFITVLFIAQLICG